MRRNFRRGIFFDRIGRLALVLGGRGQVVRQGVVSGRRGLLGAGSNFHKVGQQIEIFDRVSSTALYRTVWTAELFYPENR